MTDIILVPELENVWPQEFSGAWGNIMNSYLNNTVFALYFNNEYPEGTILEDSSYLNSIHNLPDAYISIFPNGEVFEIFVKTELRRNKIAATMCAWTRTNFISRGIKVIPPTIMAIDGKYLYQYLSLEYNEPYNDPELAPIFTMYKDFGGKSILQI